VNDRRGFAQTPAILPGMSFAKACSTAASTVYSVLR
jgi:hypothetical protein